MKKRSFIIMRNMLCVLFLILSLAGCTDFGIPDYTLTVTVESGVTGTPASGAQTLTDLTEVAYAYTPVNPLHTVEVIFEGNRMAASGTVIVYNSFTLTARLVDIRGSWKVTSKDKDGKATDFTVTFSGAGILEGTFSDSRGYTGKWTGPSNKVTITYDNWETYVYSGTLFSMTGTWANGTVAGTWSASRAN